MRFLAAAIDWRGSARAPLGRRAFGLGLLCVLALVVLACWPSTGADFEADDFGYIRLLHDKPAAHFLRLGDVSEGIWGRRLDELRPIMAFTYKLGGLLFGVDPRGLHLPNLALHLLATLLVVALVLALEPAARQAALLAGLLFGLAPAHVEALCWITGKVEPLAAIFYLGAFVAFLRYRRTGARLWYGAAVLVYAVGVFAKEILITLPLVLLLCDLLPGPEPLETRRRPLAVRLRRLLVHLPFFAAAAGLLVVRALVFGTAARAERVNLKRVLAFLELQPGKLALLTVPFPGFFEPVFAAGPAALALAALVLAGLACLLAASWHARAAIGRTLAVAFFLGVVWYGLNMAPLVVTYVSARHLYVPSCGLLAALALLVWPVTRAGLTQTSPARYALGALLVLVHAGLLLVYQHEWAAAGRRSAGIRAGLERAARELPPGSVVVLANVPAETERLMLWRAALPFALQPPFTSTDVPARLRVLWAPSLHARPLADWWSEKRPVLQGLVAGDGSAQVDLYLAQWNSNRGELVLRHARPTRGFLRSQLAYAVRRPLQEADSLSDQEGERLMRRLAAAARMAAAHLGTRPAGQDDDDAALALNSGSVP